VIRQISCAGRLRNDFKFHYIHKGSSESEPQFGFKNFANSNKTLFCGIDSTTLHLVAKGQPNSGNIIGLGGTQT
jgi:hypothetical protein